MTSKQTPTKAKPASKDDILTRLKSRSRPRRPYDVVLDEALRAKRDDAVNRLQFAAFTVQTVQQRADNDPKADVAGELSEAKKVFEQRAAEAEEAQKQLEAQTVRLDLLALPSRPSGDADQVNWTDLLAAHQPPKSSGLLFDPVTFPPALIAASIVDGPEMDDVAKLLAGWEIATVEDLFSACWDLNTKAPETGR